MKIKKIIIGTSLLLSLVACSSKNTSDLSKFVGKPFTSEKGGQILITEDKTLAFRGNVVTKANTNAKNINKDDIEKEKGGIYKNPKIVVENGKTYLKADDFKFKFILKDNSTIVDEDNGSEYKAK